MREATSEIISKAWKEALAASLLADDIASPHAVTPPPITIGRYPVRNVPQASPMCPTTIVRSAARPTRARGSLTALSVGAVSLAVLAGPATCPACNPVHADGQHDAAPIALSISTAAISPAPDAVLDGPPVAAANEATAGAEKPPETVEELPDKEQPQAETATTVDSKPEPPSSVGDTMPPSKSIASLESAEPELRTGAHSINRRRAKARIPANKESQAPLWAAKMFETPWQSSAFPF